MRATASRSSGKRSATSAGGSRTLSWLPRRSGSQPSSEVRFRIATSTSWSAVLPRMVRVHVARGDRGDAERSGEVAQRGVPARVAALERALELDVEAVAAEGAREPGSGVRVAHGEPVARAAGEADEPVVQLAAGAPGRARAAAARRSRPGTACPACAAVSEPAEVRVALRRLDEQRDVRPADERHLRAGDRPDAERLRRVRELERAVDAVVVGERERLVAELGRAERELLRLRGAVEERVGRVAVQLDVRTRLRRALRAGGASPVRPDSLPWSACADRRLRRLRRGSYAFWLNQPPASSSRNTTEFSPLSRTRSK